MKLGHLVEHLILKILIADSIQTFGLVTSFRPFNKNKENSISVHRKLFSIKLIILLEHYKQKTTKNIIYSLSPSEL